MEINESQVKRFSLKSAGDKPEFIELLERLTDVLDTLCDDHIQQYFELNSKQENGNQSIEAVQSLVYDSVKGNKKGNFLRRWKKLL